MIAADPRLLYWKTILIVAHAPHTGADLDIIEAFWDNIATAIPAKYVDWTKILLADANARFGDAPTVHIGNLQPEVSSAIPRVNLLFVSFANKKQRFVHTSKFFRAS